MNKEREDFEDMKKTIEKKSKDIFGAVKGKNIEIRYEFKIGNKKITLCVRGSGAVCSEKDISSENTIIDKNENQGIASSISKNKALKEITTIIIGTFTSLVRVGDKVEERQKIGIIRVRGGLDDHKVLSIYNGELREICLKDGEFAGYECVLFRIKEEKKKEEEGE